LISGVSTTDSSFDPVIAQPVPTSTSSLEEPGFWAPGWFPARIFAVNRLGEMDNLVITPAQFQGSQNMGELRRFTELTFTVAYSDGLDFTPPAIWHVSSGLVAETTSFEVSAGDASGIERVLVTYSADGQHWQSTDLAYRAYTDLWEGSLTGLTAETSYFVQVMDGAGNVTASDNKGQYFTPERHEIYLPVVLRST
jgi:hypothetical protein